MLARSLTHTHRPKRKARAYLFRLDRSRDWETFIGPVRNLTEAAQAIERTFGERPVALRIHSLFDPWKWVERGNNRKNMTPAKRSA
jgi:hypothetical protein